MAGLVEGSELGAALRLVMLMLARGGMTLTEMVAKLGMTLKGNGLRFLHAIRFEEMFAKPLCATVKALITKCREVFRVMAVKLEELLAHIVESQTGKAIAEWIGEVWSPAKKAIEDGIKPLREQIARLRELERRFYAFQVDAMDQLPRALGIMQEKLAQALIQQVAADEHLAAAGVKTRQPVAAVITEQRVHPRVDQKLHELEQRMPPAAKPKPVVEAQEPGLKEKPDVPAVAAVEGENVKRKAGADSLSRQEDSNRKSTRATNPDGAGPAADVQLRESYRKAYEFYTKEAGFSPERAQGHLDGIDYSKPVSIEQIKPGEIYLQYPLNGKMGNYFTYPGTPAEAIGINPAGRVPTYFSASEPTSALKSYAADIVDTWTVPGESYPTRGGGTQFFVPNKQVFSEVQAP